MSFAFNVLTSGSTGNATLVQASGRTWLIDVGHSAKKMEQIIGEAGVKAPELAGILITHEHSDHIKGLGVFARKFNIPVYANAGTWKALETSIGDLDDANRITFPTGDQLDTAGLRITSFPISHDASEPVGYAFEHGGKKLGVATDLGYASAKVKQAIFDSDKLVLEANHDTELLRMGRYPWNIKRRILGDTGHLSNEAAGEVLVDMVEGRTTDVFLAHLSLQHNMIDLARMSVNQVLRERGIDLAQRGVTLRDTYHDRATGWQTLL
jgi:phosphoribosyl 1,2-cyclic phosphodiesterase